MCSLCPVLISIHFDDFTGAYHSTKNFEIFETGTNGDKTVEFPKSEPFNRKFRKFRQEKSNGTEISSKNFSKIWVYLTKLSSFLEFMQIPNFLRILGAHGELDISRKDDGDAHSIKETL